MQYDIFAIIGIILSLAISLAGAWVSIRNARSGRIVAVEKHTEDIDRRLLEAMEDNKRIKEENRVIKAELAENKFELAQTKIEVRRLRDENLDLMKKLLK